MATVDLRPEPAKLKIARGDDFSMPVVIKEDSVLVDVSSRTYTAQLRRTKNGALVSNFGIDATNAATGTIVFTLADTVTDDLNGTYYWDFQQFAAGVVRTLMGGAFVVEPDVTRA